MATVTQIEQRVQDSTGRDDLSARIATAVQDALLEIQRKGNHYFLEEMAERALVVDRQDYNVPSDFKDVGTFYLLDANGELVLPPLEQISMEEGHEEFGRLDKGSPEKFTIYRGALWVWPPKPQLITEKLRLEYFKFLAAISGGSSNELTVNWSDLVTAEATWQFYSQLPNAEKQATFWKGVADVKYAQLERFSGLKKLKGKVVMRPRTSPRLRDTRRNRIFGGR